jgi:hypothetical protein
MSYAVVLCDRPQDVSAVLLMVDDENDAEQIAIEVRLAGHEVEVRWVSERWPGRRALPTPDWFS